MYLERIGAQGLALRLKGEEMVMIQHHRKPDSEFDNVLTFDSPVVDVLVAGVRDIFPEEAVDGYHTMAELYHYRMLYNALLFNEWATDDKYSVSKSLRHSDGEDCFGGEYFVVYAYIPHIGQITNHYKKEYWDLFKVQPLPKAPPFDNHTPKDAADRMMQYLEQSTPRFNGYFN